MEMAYLACTWTNGLNLVDFERVHVGMFTFMAFKVPFTWSEEVIDVWVDHFNLLDIER